MVVTVMWAVCQMEAMAWALRHPAGGEADARREQLSTYTR